MGCNQSKIENEEAVSRCKDRKQFMKEAVGARNAFAAAHSSYTMALKNTGAALSDYGPGEVHEIRHTAPATQPRDTLPPPPPLPPGYNSTPLLRATSMPDMPMLKSNPKPSETILEEEEDDVGSGDVTSSVPSTPPPLPPSRSPLSEPTPPPPPDPHNSTWDFFFDHDTMPHGSSLPDLEETHDPKEDVDGYDKFKKPDDDDDDDDDGDTRSTANVDLPEATPPEKVTEPAMTAKPSKRPMESASLIHQTVIPSESKRGKATGASNVNLLQILNDLDDHFLKASESAHKVSSMLEANRLHYHSNFADNRGHIDHSARVMRVITWNRSFRGLNNADEGNDDFDTEKWETHATVLDKLLAWEKKLYDEVKSGELMKIEYQRKVALLNKQKKRVSNPEALEKTKAAVSHLHTRYIVDIQSLDSTVSEINRLRDDQLYPRLVALVDEVAKMWETMHTHHDRQYKIVRDLRSLDSSNAAKETTDHHHERTVQLWRIVSEWSLQFQKLMSHQKEYIQALNSWLKLNLIPIESSLKEKVSSPPRVQRPPIQALLHSWHEQLEKLSIELAKAKSAISSFAAVIESIMILQQEERKQKAKCEETRKEYTRKNRAFEDWHRKYLERQTPPDDEDPNRHGTNVKDPATDRQFVVESLKKRLEEEEEEHQKLCRQVREKSVGSLKSHLPELFRAMSDFSHDCSEKYKKLAGVSQPPADDSQAPANESLA
ncbi:nitrate regulatory gene2 protein-like [Tasmannia lanceolata]|uniref:nitrate regulatory gene2 protein-like n=1 Tax=Tasmannia lanceolata TaxID=3420 RepID=UPI004062B6E0